MAGKWGKNSPTCLIRDITEKISFGKNFNKYKGKKQTIGKHTKFSDSYGSLKEKISIKKE
ncbi:MAG: hypothetical protein PVH61_00660 [Candidatus Aminicenantes bacterium]|jgi:hypothetical protein